MPHGRTFEQSNSEGLSPWPGRCASPGEVGILRSPELCGFSNLVLDVAPSSSFLKGPQPWTVKCHPLGC